MGAEEPFVRPTAPAPPAPPIPAAPLPPVPLVSISNGALSFTNSAWGGVIPIVYGSDRIAGNVIWASAPNTINTTINGVASSYQVMNFAVALCEGPITGILRMWVGANLVLDNLIVVDVNNVAQTGQDGRIGGYNVDLTDPLGPFAGLTAVARQTTITVYPGDEFQIAEGIMPLAEGPEGTPSYRGTAYVMFENFILPSGSIPAMTIEVTSHTASATARVYGDLLATTFDTWQYFLLIWDPMRNVFYANAKKTSPAANGIEVLDGNTLSELTQIEIQTKYSIGPFWDTTCLAPISGFLVTSAPSGNAGITYVISPATGVLMATLGPGGNLTGHDLVNGFAALAAGGVQCFASAETFGVTNPILSDIFCGVGSNNSSIGFARIESTGAITMLSTLNSVLPCINNTICPIIIDNPFVNRSPTTPFSSLLPGTRFYDTPNYGAIGTHVYGFACNNSETVSIKVWRTTFVGGIVTVGVPAATPIVPVYKQLADIPLSNFGGTGVVVNVRQVLLDPIDNCFVLVVEQGIRGTFICKYSPFTGALLWTTVVSGFPGSAQSTQGSQAAVLNGGSYAWIDSTGGVWKIALSTGSVSRGAVGVSTAGVATNVLTNLSTQSLPPISNAKQFYNGYENSLTYLTATGGQHVTKIFIDRLSRGTVLLSSIILDLIGRTGLLPSDVNVVDLAALSLTGYTVATVQSIRQCFSELGQAFVFDVAESNGKILYKTRGLGIDATVPHDSIMSTSSGGGGGASGNSNAWLQFHQLNDGSRLRKLNLTYRDVDMDYAANVQSVILTRSGTQVFDPEAFIDVTVPIAMAAPQAKQLAEILLYAKITANTTYDFTLSPSFLNLDAADVLTITMPAGEDNLTVRLRTVAVQSDNSVACTASDENPDIYTDQINLFSAIGRFIPSILPQPAGFVQPFVLQIAGRYAGEIGLSTNTYRYFFAFLATIPVVLTKFISISIDNQTFTVPPPSGTTTWGYATVPPVATQASSGTDFISSVIVDLVSTAGKAIASAPGGMADLLASDTVNLCYISGELFQFVTATNISGNRWQLTTLLRAKAGTLVGVGAAKAGDRFLLLADNAGVLDTNSIITVDTAIGAGPNKNIQIFLNSGNPFQLPFNAQAQATNLAPFAVSDFQWSYVSTDVVMTWQRSSRTADSTYPNNGTVPPAEAVSLPELAESYEIYFYKNPATFNQLDASTYMRHSLVTTNAFTYSAAMQTADSFTRTTDALWCSIFQTGSNTGIDVGFHEEHLLPHI